MHYYILPMTEYIAEQEFIDQFVDIRLDFVNTAFYAKSEQPIEGWDNYEWNREDINLHISNREHRWGFIEI